MLDIIYINGKGIIAFIWTSWLGFLTWLIGGFDLLIQVLLILMIFDYISGVIAGYKANKLNSKRAFKGIGKKIMILIVISCSSLLSYILKNDYIRDAIGIFYVATEIMSIIENAEKCGVPIPNKLKKALEQCRDEKNMKLSEK